MTDSRTSDSSSALHALLQNSENQTYSREPQIRDGLQDNQEEPADLLPPNGSCSVAGRKTSEAQAKINNQDEQQAVNDSDTQTHRQTHTSKTSLALTSLATPEPVAVTTGFCGNSRRY